MGRIPTMVSRVFSLSLLLLSACSSAETTDDEGGQQLRPVEALTIPTASPLRESETRDRQIEIRVLSSPDISARDHPVYDLSEKGYDASKEPIKVQLLNYWDDQNNYFANINFKNTGPQVEKTIYIFGFDRLGRLVSTQANRTFFRANQNLVRTLRFGKRGQAVRWSILVKD